MPLTKVLYGPNAGSRECVIGKWEVDPTGISGSYTADPLENCFFCNFYDSEKKHPLNDETACKCPEWMNRDLYYYLSKVFIRKGDGTKKTFQTFVSRLSEDNITNFDIMKKTDLVSRIKKLIKETSNNKELKISLRLPYQESPFTCETDETVKNIIEGKKDYDTLSYDEENEVRKGYYFKDQAEFIKEHETDNKKPMCDATKKECLKKECPLYSPPKNGAAKSWICREYKVYFLQDLD